jgi:hypothetical protein
MSIFMWAVAILSTFLSLSCGQVTPRSSGAVTDAASGGMGDCSADVANAGAAWGITFEEMAVGPKLQEWNEPETFFQPDNDSCLSLGIVACRKRFGCGVDAYWCYNTEGKVVGRYEPAYGDVIPCSKAQFLSWLAEESVECTRSVGLETIPNGYVTLLNEQIGPISVCGNVSLTRLRIDSHNGSFRLIFWPPLCGGPKFNTSGWSICGSSTQGAMWASDLPYLSCTSFKAQYFPTPNYLLEVSVETDCLSKCVLPWDFQSFDVNADWQSAFAAIAADFKGCPTPQFP